MCLTRHPSIRLAGSCFMAGHSRHISESQHSNGRMTRFAVTPMAQLNPRVVYLLLLMIQIVGALFIVWRELPDFRQLALNPGTQLPYLRTDDISTLGTLVIMQAAYWYRLCRVPMPFSDAKVLLSHVLLFLGRLSFIFGGSLFAVVFFRHLPELEAHADIWLMLRRGLLLLWFLFSLFCVTLELERLGHAFEGGQRN
jgi:hypothetical protein